MCNVLCPDLPALCHREGPEHGVNQPELDSDTGEQSNLSITCLSAQDEGELWESTNIDGRVLPGQVQSPAMMPGL